MLEQLYEVDIIAAVVVVVDDDGDGGGDLQMRNLSAEWLINLLKATQL